MDQQQIDRLAASVQSHAEPAFDFLARLVAARPTVGDEQTAQRVVAAEFERLGLSVRELAVSESIASDPLAGVPQGPYAGRPNVLATTAPGPLAVLFNGHVDVVPAEGGTWADPFTAVRRDGWLYGRGAGDMKCGFAMVALALAALRDAAPGVLELPIGFLSVIEEECTGNGTLASVRDGILAELVLIPEPTDLQILVGGAGIVWADVQLRSEGGHAKGATSAHAVLDLVVELIPALRALGAAAGREVPDPELGSEAYTVNVGTLSAGDWRSTVAAGGRLGVRFSHPPEWSPQEAIARIESVALRCCAGSGVSCTVTPSGYRAQGYAVSPASPAVAEVRRAHARVHGDIPGTFRVGSTTDARYYVNQAGLDAVCYGPRCLAMHAANERVELASIVAGATTIALLLAERARGEEPCDAVSDALAPHA